ncbi:hypothetical protein Bpfe_019045 [Biomphalaria pfeifferi]|uniref:Secreted protein n=1 Tax=Biomphalaria pfeifferi TaxID=112525 RepID=A0AAD8BBS4_BIOPF|nr:hypothetical protein Bpfe_019045 [Biomphalaria pfeifferi]
MIDFAIVLWHSVPLMSSICTRVSSLVVRSLVNWLMYARFASAGKSVLFVSDRTSRLIFSPSATCPLSTSKRVSRFFLHNSGT